jgi:peptide-methionine (S)-S-oxide reductase
MPFPTLKRSLLAGFSLALAALGSLALFSVPASRSQAEAQVQTQVTTLPMNQASVVLAGGCFWCLESDMDHLPGVVATTSGYAGGHVDNPTYKQVSAGGTGHYEVVKIDYDPKQVSFATILDAFWHSVDPTDPGGQFCDRGHSYKTAVFVSSPEERQIAEASKQALVEQGFDIVTPILDTAPFYDAEDYHQDFYTKSPLRYNYYRFACGRDKRVQQLWGDDAHRGLNKE